ncbi:NEQ215 [Nanoarchaeum equitans Kin4-M]|uniref:NEQ215 n=1 Tax=Nanoarchaeum equitans (strain Kin4-M) TaxID=228908 RepID=Q74MR1_NANEQ|nr:NEQ215 [Nanoarchaeum equitans Kin4-M]
MRIYSYTKIKTKYGSLLLHNLDKLKDLDYIGLLRVLNKYGYLTILKPADFNNILKIEYSLRLREANTFFELMKIYPKKLVPFLEGMFMFLDLYNINADPNYLIPTKYFNRYFIEQYKKDPSIIKRLPFYRENKKDMELALLKSIAQKVYPYYKELYKYVESIEQGNPTNIIDEMEKDAKRFMAYPFYNDKPFIGFPLALEVETTKLSALINEKYIEHLKKTKQL